MAKKVKIAQLPNAHGPSSAGSGQAGLKAHKPMAPMGKLFKAGK